MIRRPHPVCRACRLVLPALLGLAPGRAAGGTPGPPAALVAPYAAAATAAGEAEWTEFPLPVGRSGHSAILDPSRGRIVLFGGGNASGEDVWTLPLAGDARWDRLAAAGSAPSPRRRHTAIHDPLRDRMIVFGGIAGAGATDELWALSLSGSGAWSPLAAAGTPPSPREGHTAVYDPVGDRMIVFGGYDGASRNDVWALSLSGTPAWSALATAGAPPSPRAGHAAVYDPAGHRMVVFGGHDGSFQGPQDPSLLNDAWALSLGESPAWSPLAPAGSPPGPRHSHAAIHDPLRDRMIVFGGIIADGYHSRTVWSLALGGSPRWSPLDPSGSLPAPRAGHPACYDPAQDRLVAIGGESASGYLMDVWGLALGGPAAWSVIDSAVVLPARRMGHTAIHDPPRDRMLVFGGIPGPLGDLWALGLSGRPVWSEIAAGDGPPARHGHTAIYDPPRDRMLVFGGGDGPLADVWALSLADPPAWSSLTPAGVPPSARQYHSAIYDPLRDRMLVFGGFDGAPRDDLWALSLAGTPAWTLLAPAGAPPPARYLHSAIYDPPRDRMVVYGGYDVGPLDDLWALSLDGTPAWQPLGPAGGPTSARYGHSAVYDPARDRMVTFGGAGDALGFAGDAWGLALAGSPSWAPLPSPGPAPAGRYLHTAIHDPSLDRMVVFGGGDGDYHNDVWASWWTSPVSAPGPPGSVTPRLSLSAPRPNPSRGRIVLEFELRASERVALDVFDVHGRRVRRLAEGGYPAGRHRATWQGEDDQGRPVGTGVYLVRLQGDRERVTRRVAWIR
jgi:hypothetical protein